MPGPYSFPTVITKGLRGLLAWGVGVGAAFNEMTPNATPNLPVLRDGNGNAQFADPLADADAATKHYVDTTSTPPMDSAATPLVGVERDANGRAQFADPAAAQDAATKNYVTRLAPVTIFVDDFTGTDTARWQAALSAAVAAGKSVVQAGARTYSITSTLAIDGLQSVVIRGQGSGRTALQIAAGSGMLQNLFANSVGAGGTISNVIFEDFDIIGGMTNNPVGMTRTGRTFGDGVDTPILLNGNAVPTQTTNAVVSNITVRRVHIYGCQGLPVSFRGCSQVFLLDCTFERTMDAGFTWCDGVTVSRNASLWSADNGFSISRGCTNIIVGQNRVHGCWYWGVWLAGFSTDDGPQDFSCVGNEITTAGSGGITCDQGGRNGTIVGNMIRDIPRGGDGTSTYGLGIYLRGGLNTGGTHWCENVTVASNTIIDAQRGGILVRDYSRNILVDGNLIIRPGSQNDQTGTAVSASDAYNNFGVSVPCTSGEVAEFSNIQIENNFAIDDRATPYMNFGTVLSTGLEQIVTRQFNRWVGARNSTDEYMTPPVFLGVTIGRNASTSADMALNSANNSSRRIIFRSAGTSRGVFGYKSTDETGPYFTSYADNGSTTTDVFQINRTNHYMKHLRPVGLAAYTTATRPTMTGISAGACVFDTTLNKPIWWDGSGWRDASGATV